MTDILIPEEDTTAELRQIKAAIIKSGRRFVMASSPIIQYNGNTYQMVSRKLGSTLEIDEILDSCGESETVFLLSLNKRPEGYFFDINREAMVFHEASYVLRYCAGNGAGDMVQIEGQKLYVVNGMNLQQVAQMGDQLSDYILDGYRVFATEKALKDLADATGIRLHGSLINIENNSRDAIRIVNDVDETVMAWVIDFDAS